MTEKSTGDDNDGRIDNYDGNFDDNDEKITKNYQYHEFPFIWMYFLSSELDSH